MKEGNKDLLVVAYKDGYSNIYTIQSVLEYICDRIETTFEIYHKSDSGSIYAYLDEYLKDDVRVALRVSNHDILSRTNVACLGGADEEIIFRPSFENVDDLDEKIEEMVESM